MKNSLPIRLALIFLLSFPFSALADDLEVSDPIEPVNRGIFWFNDKLDVYFMEPVAEGYDYVVPDPVQRGVGNFFKNLEYPATLLSNLVQLNFTAAGRDTGRFLINTTLGIGGIFDVATEMGLERRKQDFGVALAKLGVPAGPYLVLPIFGPSNVRDGVGRIVDGLAHPFSYFYYADAPAGVSDKVNYIGRGIDGIDTRAGLLDAVKGAKESSLDYYLFMQGAYYQYRQGLIDGDESATKAIGAIDNAEGKDPLDDGVEVELKDE